MDQVRIRLLLTKGLLRHLFPNKAGTGQSWLAIAIALIATIVFLCNTVITETRRYKYDFAGNYVAWYAAQHRLALYDPLIGRQGGPSPYLNDLARQAGVPGEVPHFVYSPAFAAPACLFPALSYRRAELIAVWSSAIAWLACVGGLTYRLLSPHYLAAAGLFALATLYPPMLFTVNIGQGNIYIFLALVTMVWCLHRNHKVTAGIAIGLAMVWKMHLSLFLLYFLVTRRWTTALSAIITVLSLVVFSLVTLGIEPWDIYLHDVFPTTLGGMAYIANQSLAGVVARFFTTDAQLLFTDALIKSSSLSLLSKAFSGLLIGITSWQVFKSRRHTTAALQASAVILCLLLASPVAFIHHFVWCYLPIVVLWSSLLCDDSKVSVYQAVPLTLGTLMLFLPWTTFFQLFLGHNGWPRILACNTFMGAFLLWLAALSTMRSLRSRQLDRQSVSTENDGPGSQQRLNDSTIRVT